MDKKEIEKIKKSIYNILDMGGTVSFSYKASLDSWVQTVTISYFPGYYSKPTYNIHGGPVGGDYDTKEEAVDRFVDCIFNKNLSVILDKIKKDLNIVDFENEGYDFEYPSEEFLNLIEKYKNE